MSAATFTGWLLALHLLSAFALVGALSLFAIVFVTARRIDDVAAARALRPVARLGRMAYGAGMAGTVVFGVWMVLRISRYSLSSGWILTALILWVVVGALGGRGMTVYRQATAPILDDASAESQGTARALPPAYRGPTMLGLDAGAAAAAIAILVLMIWKPGA